MWLPLPNILTESDRQRDGKQQRHLKRQQNAVLQPLKQQIEAADARIRELKQQRKALSRQLQAQMQPIDKWTKPALAVYIDYLWDE